MQEMHKQTDGKMTALYYRRAVRTDAGTNLDNQMQTLLCHAKERGCDSFVLYADVGASGSTFNRPALNALKRDIEAGHIGRVLVTDTSRLGRAMYPVVGFMDRAEAHGVQIEATNQSMTGDAIKLLAALHSLMPEDVGA